MTTDDTHHDNHAHAGAPARDAMNPSRSRGNVVNLVDEAQSRGTARASADGVPAPPSQTDSRRTNTPKLLAAGQSMTEIWQDIARIPRGIPALAALQGVQPHIAYQPGLSIIAAPTSAGKTTFLIAQVAEWLLDPHLPGKILFWSAETPRPKLWAKLLAQAAKMTMWDVVNEIRQAPSRHGARVPELEQARQTFAGVSERLIIMDEDATGVGLLELADRLAAGPDGLLAVVIDYLQELPAVPDDHPWADRVSRNRELEIGWIARELRRWGMRAGVPVLAAAQFNRTVSKSSGWVPDLLQLRESGRIEQNAGLVLGLRNETMSGAQLTAQNNAGVAHPKTYASWDPDALERGRQSGMLSVRHEHPAEDGWILLEAFVLKNREYGGVGTVVPMALNAAWGRVEPLQERITVHGEKRPSGPSRPGQPSVITNQEVQNDQDDYFSPR